MCGTSLVQCTLGVLIVRGLGGLFDEAEIVQRFKLDTITRLLSEDELNRWSDVKDSTASELGLQQHRAANDVTLLRKTFESVKTPD